MAKSTSPNIIGYLVLSVIIAYTFSQVGSISLISVLYTISALIREILIIALPFIIFSSVVHSLKRIESRSSIILIFITLITLSVSNFLSSLVGYFLSINLTSLTSSFQVLAAPKDVIYPVINIKFINLISNDLALAMGFLVGLTLPVIRSPKLEIVLNKAHKWSMLFLTKLFVPVLPLFINGYATKMFYEGEVFTLIGQNKVYIIAIFVAILTYIFVLYFIAAKFKLQIFKSYLLNIFPPAVTALSTMSSAAALPLSMKAAEENTKDATLPNLVVPTTVSIHLVGDSIFIPATAIMLMVAKGMSFPSLSLYIIFSLYFVLNKFAVAAVPGGGIIVMLPVLEEIFGFSPEMGITITGLYMLLDPLITCCNVLGNGVFVIVMKRLLNIFKSFRPKKI